MGIAAVLPQLDLSRSAVGAYWTEVDPRLGELIRTIEQTEDWTLDRQPDIARRLVALGQRMQGTAGVEAFMSADTEDLLVLMALISAGRSLRVIQWLDSAGGHGTALVQRLLQTDGAALINRVIPSETLRGVVAARLRVLENADYLNRLLAPERLLGIQLSVRRTLHLGQEVTSE